MQSSRELTGDQQAYVNKLILFTSTQLSQDSSFTASFHFLTASYFEHSQRIIFYLPQASEGFAEAKCSYEKHSIQMRTEYL